MPRPSANRTLRRWVASFLEAGAIVLKDEKPWMIVIENAARD
jgi:hypothetical protein